MFVLGIGASSMNGQEGATLPQTNALPPQIKLLADKKSGEKKHNFPLSLISVQHVFTHPAVRDCPQGGFFCKTLPAQIRINAEIDHFWKR